MLDGTGRNHNRHYWLGSQAILFALLLCAGCKAKTPDNKTFPFLQRYSSNPSEKTDLVKLEGEDGQWIMPAKNYASTRFSGLNQINVGNVKNLKVAWTFSTGSDRGEEPGVFEERV